MSWHQLRAIEAERALERERERGDAPTACPNDGEPLEAAPGGGLRCPFDGWAWPAYGAEKPRRG